MWSSRLKKKLADMRTDLNHRIDRLEVDKNQLLNSTQRKLQGVFAINGVEYSLEREACLAEVERMACVEYEQQTRLLARYMDEWVEARTSGLFASFRTLSKEMQLVSRALESVAFILQKVNASCDKLSADMDELERAYASHFDKQSRVESEEREKEAQLSDLLDKNDQEANLGIISIIS
jgi:hypothetical protein